MDLSIEIFPPTTRVGRQKLEKLIDNNIDKVDTISVTQTSSDYSLTRFIVRYFDNDPRIVPHITSGLGTKSEIKNIVSDLISRGTNRFLLLTGDNPGKTNDYYQDAFTMMYDLHYTFPDIQFISTFYPHPHKKFISDEEDRKLIENKVNLNTQRLFGQMCFYPEVIIDKIKAIKPNNTKEQILRPGIVAPLTKFSNLYRICYQNGIQIPESLTTNMPAITDKLIGDLTASGINQFHIYAMNNEDNLKRCLEIINQHTR